MTNDDGIEPTKKGVSTGMLHIYDGVHILTKLVVGEGPGLQTNGNWRFIYTFGSQIRKKDIFKKRSDNVGLRLRQYWRFGWFWASIDCDLMWQQADGPHGKPNEVPHPFSSLFLSLLQPPHQRKIVLANMRQHYVISTLLLWHWSVVNDLTWNIEPYVF